MGVNMPSWTITALSVGSVTRHQAAIKLVRAMHGETPLPEEVARACLIEEIADVNVCLVALDPDQYAIEAMMCHKACRWERRLNATERGEE